MEEISTILYEKEASTDTLSQQLFTVMNMLPERERSDNKNEQRVVLNSLGNNFVQEMTGHIYNVIRNEEQRKKEGKSNQYDYFNEHPENYIRGHLKGEIFERFVALDPLIIKERFGENILKDPSKMRDMENLSNEILSVMQNPSRYGLQDSIKLGRLPDATYINITEAGYVEIVGVGEAKSGVIDDRFYSQVINYQKSLEIISKGLSKIQHPKRLRNLGLNNLANRMEQSGMEGAGNFVRSSSNLKKTLIVPQDKIIEEDWVEDVVDNILYSSFTTYEVDAVTNWVLKKIQENES